MYNIIDNISKIFETCDNPFKIRNDLENMFAV